MTTNKNENKDYKNISTESYCVSSQRKPSNAKMKNSAGNNGNKKGELDYGKDDVNKTCIDKDCDQRGKDLDNDASMTDDKFSLTDQWVSETVRMVTSQAISVSNVEQNDDFSDKPVNSDRRKSISKRRKKKKDNRRLSTAISMTSENEKTTSNLSLQTNQYRDSLQIPLTTRINEDENEEFGNLDTIPSGADIGRSGRQLQFPVATAPNQCRKGTKSKLELPSLVFTAAGSNLDEGLDTGQGLNHISYSMNEFNTANTDSMIPESSSRQDNFRKCRKDRSKEKLKDGTEGKLMEEGKEGKKHSKRTRRKKKNQGELGDLEDDLASYSTNPVAVGSERLPESLFEHSHDFVQHKKRKSLPENPTIAFYFKVCKKLGVLPLRKVIQQFGRSHMTFKNLTLTSRDMKALCLTLQKETHASSVDFTGNFIQAKELSYIISVVSRLHTIFQVSLCNNCLHGQGISDVSRFLLTNDFLTRLDISGNKLTDQDASYVTAILKANTTLKTLLLNHNEFREEGGKLIGQALGENTTLEDIDLSWNHLRRCGAIGIANGLQQNTALRTVNLAWNGFGFEGCVAIGDMMCNNTSITELDLSYNRISPPALLELLRGIAGNKTLRILKMGYNPVTASFSSLILVVVQKHRESALENIDLAGVVVDKEFVSLLEEIQKDRFFIVNYEVSLPVKKMSREEMREKIGLPSAYNVDPLRMLYLLKEKMRASDFFYKINKDNDDGLQRDELYELFDEAGLPVTGSVVDKIMEFMDTNGDGTIDLGEFLQGDKRIKNMSRKQIRDEQERRAKDGNSNKYSRTFQKAHIDPISLALKVDPTTAPMRQSTRRLSAPKLDSETEDNNHLKIP